MNEMLNRKKLIFLASRRRTTKLNPFLESSFCLHVRYNIDDVVLNNLSVFGISKSLCWAFNLEKLPDICIFIIMVSKMRFCIT